MAFLPPNEEISRAESLLLVAEKHVERLIGAVEDAIQRVAADKDAPAGASINLSRDLSKGLQTLFEERSRIDKLRKYTTGAEQGDAIDFEQARAAIGRRLARLRAAQDSGGISE